jgi:hypothetical protein
VLFTTFWVVAAALTLGNVARVTILVAVFAATLTCAKPAGAAKTATANRTDFIKFFICLCFSLIYTRIY